MSRCELNVFLFYKKSELGKVILYIYVDDFFSIGNKEAIMEIVEILKKHFSVKLLDTFNEYVGCKMVEFNNKNGYINQTC